MASEIWAPKRSVSPIGWRRRVSASGRCCRSAGGVWRVALPTLLGLRRKPHVAESRRVTRARLAHRSGSGRGAAVFEDTVDFERVIPWKTRLLRQAFAKFHCHSLAAGCEEHDEFVAANAEWLAPFARFMAMKEASGGVSWTDWRPGNRGTGRRNRVSPIRPVRVLPSVAALRDYACARSIRFMGDVPIYVAHDSADVWAHPNLFQVDEHGRPLAVSGVPPDYFSATGQLWGNPLYRWDRMAADGFEWWIKRMRAAFGLFDLARMDHFRGFQAYGMYPPASRPPSMESGWKARARRFSTPCRRRWENCR